MDDEEVVEEAKYILSEAQLNNLQQATDNANKRRLIISELMLQGKSTMEIADVLREQYGIIVSHATVSIDMKRLREDYRIRIADNVDAEMALDLARIDRMIQEMYPMWSDRHKQEIYVCN